MYPDVLAWVEKALNAGMVEGRDVLEVGSYDVNGSARPYIESLGPRKYLGVDAAAGPRVDSIVDCEQLTAYVGFDWDVVLSTEMLEHVQDWQTCIEQMVEVTTPRGLLLVTTCSPGFPYHPFPGDYWRFSVDDMILILTAIGLEVLLSDVNTENHGVFTLSRKPPGWVRPANHRDVWSELDVTMKEPI